MRAEGIDSLCSGMCIARQKRRAAATENKEHEREMPVSGIHEATIESPTVCALTNVNRASEHRLHTGAYWQWVLHVQAHPRSSGRQRHLEVDA